MWNLEFSDNAFGDPLRRMGRLQEEINRLFRAVEPGGAHRAAPINLRVEGETAVATAEIPGVKAADIAIAVMDDILTLKGVRPPEPVGEGEVPRLNERWAGTFSRTVRLPFRAESGATRAELAAGVLTVTMPRAEEDKPKKISVKAR